MSLLGRFAQHLKLSKIGLRPPDPAPGREGIAIAAIVRDEAPHVAEWARFHHLSGVGRFLIYDDASTDGTVAALRAALPGEALTVIPWGQRLSDLRLRREVHNQVLAYAHAASNFGGAVRWMAFIDVDEFLVPTAAPDLPAALRGLDVPAVSLPWHMFGTGGHATPPPGTVEHFTRRARDVAGTCAYKSLVDPCRLTALRVHSVETDGTATVWNDRGASAPDPGARDAGFVTTDRLQLNHYYTRSRADLEAKLARGPNLAAKRSEYHRKVLRKVDAIERDTVEDLLARDHARRLGLGRD